MKVNDRPGLLAWALVLVAIASTSASAQEQEKPAFSAADLLDAKMLPDAGFGMKVESAEDGEIAQVVTSGAEVRIDKQNDTIECRQRLAKERPVAIIHLAKGALTGVKLQHQSAGAAIFSGGNSTIRVNCDSLVMVRPNRDGEITAELAFTPDFHNEFKGNVNFFDPFGGISFFENGHQPGSTLYAADDPVRIVWPWKAGDVFWAAISPPKPFDWQASIRDRVIWCGSSEDRWMYPSDGHIVTWKRFSNILYLHNEMAWEHWNLSLVPRDKANYLRVMRTAHEFGMKVIVYASPHFFTKGTSAEAKADPDPHVGIGQFSGANAEEYLRQATRIVKEFETDGLYFDEIYSSRESLATQYWLTRKSRELVGDSGLLFFHSTTDVLGAPHTGPVCPPLNAWFNIIYKGEGEWNRWDPGYTRYVLSQHNTSNAIGVHIVDDRFEFSPAKMNFWLRHANARFFLPAYAFYNNQIDLYEDLYWPQLTDKLQGDIERDLLAPTGVFAQFRNSIRQSLGKKEKQ